ncbi:MAG TPA: 2-amino-4-hydroxy-6-hydroxymethyldihydropteridine diphosphokinase [Candidatus Aminicenantes bacterium]|nr:2-amino-4-hydroxy-6-hydroxymethyldihydropteridine diphosphokinase [Acidobacteriota bacterium]HNQ81192.1 2-amino-4-hydroxy-6-hydroxymethyldihydropteridine diphosphokinase [Candidatus Aminicenantes bacterium]HOY99248.1 2-amino-4-hydroxy-6-hydroxymethyldihydropteridine diphosphokinase [Candidatus Aminicenantes bacterium]HPH44367.1 2-amino-4-hydroxy-6-hydroxymethyldihydropteridine diphosphokinase [Candidatus Aminicenantes bacterium]HPN16263.1 2-amino-4-hydroxy-6-hydroxymethyldihydropteridine dip
MRYYLGLGGNTGDRFANLEAAVRRLREEGVRIIGRSSIYRTEPVGLRNQPWFLNQALKVETRLSPEQLLKTAKAVEAGMGRKPGRRNGPRPIDIDLLLAGKRNVRTAGLQIPHPRLAERRFVLVPLAEIAPRAVHPVLRKTIRSILRDCPDASAVRRLRRD